MDKFTEPNIPKKFLKPYNSQEVENKIYEMWEKSGYFNPDNLPERHKEPFSIVLPPPNVTGTLHMGHALMLTIEDIMTRYKRMQGFKALWIPGTDHAAIATQSKVEGMIYKEEGKRRHDLGRETFLKRVEDYAQKSHDTIVLQTKRMGASLDWSREAYTLDEQRNKAVNKAFKEMYEQGLIYRKYRVVNWDPKGQTTVSDEEVNHELTKSSIYTFKYSKDFPISIATTRPETKVGDTAVAVHPDDTRYQKYIGKEYDVVFANVPLHIKIIADVSVDPAYGTGAVGVTPAHSAIDWKMGEVHKLPLLQVIDEFGKMMVEEPNLKGKKVAEARTIIVEWLKKECLLEKEEIIENNVSKAERTGGLIEPLPKLQWWVDVNKKIANRGNKSLKELMQDVIEKNSIEIIPDRFGRVYLNWIKNLEDWCISRQIWYGHRIPVWYKDQEISIGEVPKGDGWTQDEDTLDTWFSSGLWTFSTLGWPEKTKDLELYHPTSILETGYDIIFFWVARMILMSTCLLGEIPFKTVYLHGIIRNPDGSKMSKSSGAIDPLLMCEKYGTDAVRMSLIIGMGPGNDSKMSEDKIRAYKNFANKLWNITRFVLSSTEGDFLEKDFSAYTENDKGLQKKWHELISEISKEMDEYKFYIVGEKLYSYIWHEFADIILEDSKNILKSGTEAEKKSRKQFLLATLGDILKTLHPFAPFVTEEIWSDFPAKDKKPLIIETWPI